MRAWLLPIVWIAIVPVSAESAWGATAAAGTGHVGWGPCGPSQFDVVLAGAPRGNGFWNFEVTLHQPPPGCLLFAMTFNGVWDPAVGGCMFSLGSDAVNGPTKLCLEHPAPVGDGVAYDLNVCRRTRIVCEGGTALVQFA